MTYSCQSKGASLENTTDVTRSKIALHHFISSLHKGLQRVYIAGEHGSGMAAHKSAGPGIAASTLQIMMGRAR